MDDIERLLSLSPEELRKLGRQEVHEGYKNIIKRMLFDFFVDSNVHFNGLPDEQISVKDITDFVSDWAEQHFKMESPLWEPGMSLFSEEPEQVD